MLRDKRANSYLTLDPLEYYSELTMAGTAQFAAGGGLFQTAIQLWNDDPNGNPIYIYDFFLQTTAAINVQVFPTSTKLSNAGQIFNSVTPMNSNAPQRAGHLFGSDGLPAFQGGAWIIPVGASGYQWNKDWPLTDIPANAGLQFQCFTGNTGMTLAAIWLQEPSR
jgi:hypothetical protein